jgi:hypothetical protein
VVCLLRWSCIHGWQGLPGKPALLCWVAVVKKTEPCGRALEFSPVFPFSAMNLLSFAPNKKRRRKERGPGFFFGYYYRV